MSSRLHTYHYNIQLYADWQTKVERDKDYLRDGWAWEVKNFENTGVIPITGISTLGL